MIQQSRWVLIILLLPVFAGQAETFSGKVVRVLDGDTAEVLDSTNTPHRIRLVGIDAPENAQPFGTKAKQALLKLVGGQVVEVEWSKIDKYGRMVGKLVGDGQDVNLAMVRAGLAWWYRQYAKEQSAADRGLYEAAEAIAKAERRGLWVDPAPVPPWDWRHPPTAPGGTGAACPCDSGAICTGPKGGQFCITESGIKRYFPRKQNLP